MPTEEMQEGKSVLVLEDLFFSESSQLWVLGVYTVFFLFLRLFVRTAVIFVFCFCLVMLFLRLFDTRAEHSSLDDKTSQY